MASYGAQSHPPHKKQDSTTQDEQSRSERVVGDVVIYPSEADGDAGAIEEQEARFIELMAAILAQRARVDSEKDQT
jgi:hypothetical protein